MDSDVEECARELRALIAEAKDNELVAAANAALTRFTQRRIGRLIGRRTEWRCAGGPFAGMRLHHTWRWCLAPCLLGTYEAEIAGWIEALIAARPPLVVDVGAGDGYYAVGLAMRLPDTRVVAADSDPLAQSGTKAQAALNGVEDRVEMLGEIRPADLQALLVPGAVLLSDCEGYEDILLDPVAVPALARTTVIVELHDFIAKGVSDRVAQRFGATHTIDFRDA